jgi:4-hydroxyacetophenone monooxygenase
MTKDDANVKDIDTALLRKALRVAEIPALIPLLVELTGDEKWLGEPYAPERPRGMDPGMTGGLAEEIQDEVRDAAFDAIMARQAGELSPQPLDDTDLVRLLAVASGDVVPEEYGPMIASVIATTADEVPPQLDWSGRKAVIMGAGISGLATAIHLQKLGLPFVIFERKEDLGGSWFESRYPGCGVDTPSHIYEFSFFPNDWENYFAMQKELLSYIRAVADTFDIKRHIHFNTTVEAARWDEATNQWALTVSDVISGKTEVMADFVFSTVGVFNHPLVPDVPGLDSFSGPIFHTSDWQDVDLTGKRVAVFGNGASAMQVVPAIAPTVEHLTIVQRTPHWIAPFPRFLTAIPDEIRYLMKVVPEYRAWFRLGLMWRWMDQLHPILQKDPSWAQPERSVNSRNDRQRIFFTNYLKSELEGRPDLIEQTLPTYPPFGKRMLNDNGWFATLLRDNVSLETSPDGKFVGDTLVVNDHEYPIDVVVLATGYKVVRFLSTLSVTGREGATLDDIWGDDDTRAFLGLAVPKLPNFFILVGPNIAPGHGGSLIMSAEACADYTERLLREFHARGGARLEVTKEAYDSYNQAVDEAHANMVWTHPGVSPYTRNKAGRVVMSSPFKIIDFWERTRSIDWGDWTVDA